MNLSQVADYLSTHTPSPGELFVFWAGFNDMIFGFPSAAFAVQSLRDQISSVVDAGARSVVVGNLPPYHGQFDVPRYKLFNELLSSAVSDLSIVYPDTSFIEFDYSGFIEMVLADPPAFGFTNMMDPACADCGVGFNLNPVDIVSYPDEYFFWDDVHPSAAAQRFIGEAAFAVVIPEPSARLQSFLAVMCLVLARRPQFRRFSTCLS